MAGFLQPPIMSKKNEIETELSEEEAVAMALEMCPPGESISLHRKDCEVTPEEIWRCTCIPMVLRKDSN